MGLFLAAKCRPLPTNSPTIFKPCKKTKEGACVKKQKVSWLDLFWKAFKHLTWSSVDFREYDVRIRVNASAKNCGNYILMFLPVKKKTKKSFRILREKIVDNKHFDFLEIYLLFDWKHKVNLGIGILCEVHKSPAALWVNCHWKLNKDWFKNITRIHIVPNWTYFTIYF